MGNVYARHTSPSSQVRLLLMGPASAGKTTILYRLRLGEVVTTIPTLGFNVETLTHRTTVFTAWDVGGRDKVRPLWRHYYQGTDAVMFVVDSADRGDSLDAARDEFRRALNEEELAGKPVLLFCNKQDLPGALSPAEVAERLGFYSSKIHDRPLLVLPCCATKGEGLREGLEWIRNAALAKGGGPANPKGTKVNGPSSGPTKSAAGATSGNDPSESLGYDPSENITLRRFAPIKLGTECPFAKASKLWGGIPGDGRSPEEQARADAGPLREFVRRCARKNERLDGFCVDLDGGGGSPEELGERMWRYLTALSDVDPAGERAMRATYVGRRGWRFRFAGADFFVATFAPCYPASSSRYGFGTGRTFLLLQPEVSFARHDLPPDTPHTNWDDPQTVRDRTRVAFRDAGRGYHIPETTRYPPAEHIVKPLDDDGSSVVKWWQEGDPVDASAAHAA